MTDEPTNETESSVGLSPSTTCILLLWGISLTLTAACWLIALWGE